MQLSRANTHPLAVHFFLVLLLATAFSSATTVAQQQDHESGLILTRPILIDPGTSEPREVAALVISDGKISEIRAKDVADDFATTDAEVVDLAGKFLIPGLIDAHVHVWGNSDPKAELERILREGVTSVRDMGGDARTLAVLARDARMGAILSPDIYFSALLYGPPFLRDPRTRRSARGYEPGTAPWSRVVTPDAELDLLIAEAKGTGATGLKLYSALDPELVGRIVDEAHRQGLKVWSHATIFPSRPSDAVEAGVDVISHALGLFAEGRPDVPSTYTEGVKEWMPRQDLTAVTPNSPPYDRLFASMRAHGILLDATLSAWAGDETQSMRQENAEPSDNQKGRFNLASIQQWTCKAVRAAHEAGVTIIAGTDTVPRRHRPLALELELLVECGLTPQEALLSATTNAARALGIEGTHGSLEVGKVANLVILDSNPMESISNVRKVAGVVKAGHYIESLSARE